jgi:hypothetical protein
MSYRIKLESLSQSVTSNSRLTGPDPRGLSHFHPSAGVEALRGLHLGRLQPCDKDGTDLQGQTL